MSALRTRPADTEYAPYYSRYVSKVPEGDVVELLRAQLGETLALLRGIPEERAAHRYAEGKWSIKEVVGHMSDAERIFAYRALRFARGDDTPLASFDENAFVRRASFDHRTLASLASELEAVRHATIALYDTMTETEAVRTGIASEVQVTPRALAYIIAGHERHHVAILRERYL